jgi:hypothetical protein
VLANMSNLSSAWAGRIFSIRGAPTAFIRIALQRDALAPQMRDEHAPATTQDVLCIVLAIFTSAFLAKPASAKLAIELGTSLGSCGHAAHNSDVSATCAARPACLRSCCCINAKSLSQHLTDIYLRETTEIEADLKVNGPS